ncbi:hypothetical protein NRA10_10530 [Acinetobacter baumannii]|nr:hypothetical protein [Acinetobacter baumannii]
MKPEQFIRVHGIKRAKECIPSYEKHYCGLEKLFVEDLKRLVESVELVEKFGSLIAAKAYVPDGYKSDRLKQAIRDHESIYGGGDE